MNNYQQIQGLTQHAETRLKEFVQEFGNPERIGWETAYIACLGVLEDNLNCASLPLSWELPVADSNDGCAHTFTAELDDLIIVNADEDDSAASYIIPDESWLMLRQLQVQRHPLAGDVPGVDSYLTVHSTDAHDDPDATDPVYPASRPRGVQR
ncbi:hypothetical protein [Xanthomonas campestris]|uniref:hypothetical protein n=1 Tax=Xanthomonas campestris TaxID=339 RepID=UPI002377D40A|nr:hypothetical protein [Xanthomonas campestris]WDK04531.1 hypothetical protein JH273_21690 [Xanthomonas campestris]